MQGASWLGSIHLSLVSVRTVAGGAEVAESVVSLREAGGEGWGTQQCVRVSLCTHPLPVDHESATEVLCSVLLVSLAALTPLQ